MSNDLRNAVWDRGPADPTQRFVLLSLADRADEKGYCWPSYQDTAKRTGYKRRTVINAMRKLETDGWVATETRYKAGAQRSSNGVQINLARLLNGEQRSPSIVNYDHLDGEQRSPESSIESSFEPVNEVLAPPPTPFVIVREHFVRKTGIQPNDRTGTYERDWQNPLEAILHQARGDPAAAMVLIDAALAVAWGENDQRKTYTVGSPRSIVGIAANLQAARAGAAQSSDADALWRRALEAIRNGITHDERLRLAVRAVGTERIRQASERDAERLKGALVNEYRRLAPTAQP